MKTPIFCAAILLGVLLGLSRPVPAEERSVPESAAALLESAIAHYREIAARGGWPAVPEGPKIEPDDEDARIPAIRSELILLGDYQGPASNMPVYDLTLEKAVEHFQERNGLKADGIIGAQTIAALNVPVENRIAGMEASLIRMREFKKPAASRYVLVNIPGYYLLAVENGRVAFSSRVIVGDPDNQTPLFSNAVTSVEFNPSWHVPPRIATKEIAVKIQSNPNYLLRAGFVITNARGQYVNPWQVDWSRAGSYRIRQKPGNFNALGKVKFNLPNNDDIYLHGTSAPQLFSLANRDLSHGCVRVAKPREMTYFLMQGMKHWPKERIDEAYDGNRTRTVPLPAPVPVYAVYWTSWVDEAGTVHFAPDVYGQDKPQTEAKAEKKQEPAMER